MLAVDTQIANGKAGVIAGDRIALAVDAGIDDAEGAAVLATARALGREQVELVYTHGHIDHTLGGTAFAGLPIHARPEVSSYMRSQLNGWAGRSDETPQQLDERMGWPTVPVDGEPTLELGGRRVRLLDTPGHAPGALCVFDPDRGVLFGGDTIVTSIPPAFSDGDAVVLARTLRTLAGLDSEILVPGHGGVVVGRSAVREAIEWSATYLERCYEHVTSNPTLDAPALLAAGPYEAFIGDRLPRDRYRMEWRHEQTLRTMSRQIRDRN